MKIIASFVACVLLVPVLFLGVVASAFGAVTPNGISNAFDIPPQMLALYVEASVKFSIPAPVLAAVGKVECDHNRNRACDRPNYAGAQGPMQFLSTTFVGYSWASGNPSPSPYNERDAVFAAAALLEANGINRDLRTAIYSYNHSWDYVDLVSSWAGRYGSLGSGAAVVENARSYLGVPYVWGGASPSGMDCSGLVLLAYKSVEITMPRVAQDQARRGVAVSSMADLRAGDLLAYGSGPNAIDHIAIYTENGKMIEAPHTGAFVREVKARTNQLVAIRRVLS